jgi:tetratricopeptide (TPR) repeat protein
LTGRARVAIGGLAALVLLATLVVGSNFARGGNGAVAHLHTQVSRGEGDVETYRQLARALAVTGDVTGAEAALRAGLKREPQSAPAQRDLGMLYLESNRPAEALPLLEQALSHAPEDSEIRDALSYALYQAGDAVGSLEVTNHGEPLGRAQAEALVEAARFYMERGHPEAAERALAKALELAPESLAVSSALHSAMHEKSTEAVPERGNPPTAVLLVLTALVASFALRALFRRGRAALAPTLEDPQELEGSFPERDARSSWTSKLPSSHHGMIH